MILLEQLFLAWGIRQVVFFQDNTFHVPGSTLGNTKGIDFPHNQKQ
jgi:hypothetical protein